MQVNFAQTIVSAALMVATLINLAAWTAVQTNTLPAGAAFYRTSTP